MKGSLRVVLVVMVTAGICHPEPVMTTIPLEYVRGEGCVFDARGATLPADLPGQREDGIIVIEAERPLRYFCDPRLRAEGAAPPTDPAASGGKYLDQIVTAQYQFRVQTAGEYWLWLRVATPKGTSRVRDLVNGGMWYFYEEKDKEAAEGWYWGQRRKVTLAAGLNRLALTEYHTVTPAVDQVLFAPSEQFAPEGTYQERRVPNSEGWVETAPVAVPGLVRLTRVIGLPAQTSAVQAALGGGAWQALRYDPTAQTASLDGLAGEGALKVRVQLAPGVEPEPGKIALQAEVDPRRFVDLDDGQTRCVFDADSGGLFLIEDLRAGRAICTPGAPRPLVSVDLKHPGEAEWTRMGPESVTRVVWKEIRSGTWGQSAEAPEAAQVRPVRCEGGARSFAATFRFRRDGVGEAEVSYQIRPGDGGAWNWEVTARCLQGPADVVAVEFPILEHLCLGGSGLDDRQFRPQSFGDLAFQPGMHPLRDDRYCGSVVMPWQSLWDNEGGFYVGAHDPRAVNLLFISRSSGIEGEHFTASFRKLDDIKPGEECAYTYVVAAHPGTWHWGADRYREWFYDTFSRAQYPAWVDDCDGFLDIQAENYREAFTFAGLAQWMDVGQAVGVDWMQVWGQFSYSFGPCCAAWYGPSPQYGGAEEWRNAAQAIKARGGHLGGYFHYAYLDLVPILTDWYLGHFRKSEYPADTPWVSADYFQRVQAILDPDGRVPDWPPADEEVRKYLDEIDAHQEAWRAGQRAQAVFWWKTVWVNDPEWWEYLRSWIADKYVREWGCNTAYIDVLGTGGASESYDPRRGHNGEGTWGLGRLGLARTVTESAREADPDFLAAMEGMGDLPGLYCASMCSGVYRGGRNVLRYTFPERVFIHGVANAGSGESYLDRFLTTFREAMRYDIGGTPGPESVPLLQLQRSFHPRLYQARFMDTIGLETSHPRIEARWLHDTAAGARAAIITITNRDYLAGQTVSFDGRQLGGVRAGFYVTLSGEAGSLDLMRTGQTVSFTVPQELASMAYLVSDVGAGEAVWPVLRLVAAGQPHLALTLFNLTDREQSGRCVLENLGFPDPRQGERDRAHAALPLTQTAQDFALPPLAARTLRFPLQSVRHHYYTVRMKAALDLDDVPDVAREFLVLPFVHDGSFELAGNDSEQVVEGARSLRLGPSLEGYQHRTVRLWVLPNRKYRVAVEMRRDGFQARIHGTALVIGDTRGNAPIVRAPVDTNRVNQWQTCSYEFVTPPDLQTATLYLYNVESPQTAWFDDIRVEDLGPVAEFQPGGGFHLGGQ